MVEQKVFRSGNSLVISLPKKFCKRNRIVKGDRLNIVGLQDDALKISLVSGEEKEGEQ